MHQGGDQRRIGHYLADQAVVFVGNQLQGSRYHPLHVDPRMIGQSIGHLAEALVHLPYTTSPHICGDKYARL